MKPEALNQEDFIPSCTRSRDVQTYPTRFKQNFSQAQMWSDCNLPNPTIFSNLQKGHQRRVAQLRNSAIDCVCTSHDCWNLKKCPSWFSWKYAGIVVVNVKSKALDLQNRVTICWQNFGWKICNVRKNVNNQRCCWWRCNCVVLGIHYWNNDFPSSERPHRYLAKCKRRPYSLN